MIKKPADSEKVASPWLTVYMGTYAKATVRKNRYQEAANKTGKTLGSWIRIVLDKEAGYQEQNEKE